MQSEINNSDMENVYYIADIFDDVNQTVFVDWCHISGDGNKIIADKMAEIIINDEHFRNGRDLSTFSTSSSP